MTQTSEKSKLLDVFRQIQGAHKDSFSTSLPYYLLTGRNGCKVYTDGTATVTVAIHPHDGSKLLVFPEMNGNYDLTVKILNHLAEKGLKVQLARYLEEDFTRLEQARHRDLQSKIADIRLVPEDILDWRYPAHIIDTQTINEMSGKTFTKLRRAYNRAGAVEGIEITPLRSEEGLLKMRGSILIWVGLMISAGKETGHDMTEFYDTLVQCITDYPSLLDGFIVTKDREPVGFTIWDTNNGDTANALANLTRRSLRDMSEYQLIIACQMLHQQGIQRLNLGGSEIPELDKFKLKFRPVDSLDLKSYEVDYKDMDFFSVTDIIVVPNRDARLTL